MEITPGFLLLMAGALCLDEGVGLLPWALAACAVHEGGHVLAARLLGGRVERLALSAVGAELRFSYPRPLSYGREFFVTAMGPAANLVFGLLLLRLGGLLPGMISLVVGAFNLLPILPLDGGRMGWALLSLCFEPHRAEMILLGVESILVGLVVGAGAIAAVKYANVTLLVTGGWLFYGVVRQRQEMIEKTG